MAVSRPAVELVCPAGTPAALRAAVDAGADTVYLGFRDATNARNFPGLNFSREELSEGVTYAHARGATVYVAINTFPEAGEPGAWHAAIDDAATHGADAIIVADIGLLAYAAERHPDLRRHLSVQASASNVEALKFYHREFGIKRAVLPRVLTVPEIAALTPHVPVECEVFLFGGLCPMAEGRCLLSSYVTGESPNRNGACSPASHVHYVEQGDTLVTRLGDLTVNVFKRNEPAGYPTLCKGRFAAGGNEASYLFEEPASLNLVEMLPDLIAAGAKAFKIEGRQRGRAYITEAVGSMRRALDACLSGGPPPAPDMLPILEGRRETAGAYRKTWR